MKSRSLTFLCVACALAASILVQLPVAFHAAPQGSSSGYHVIRNILLGGEGGWDTGASGGTAAAKAAGCGSYS